MPLHEADVHRNMPLNRATWTTDAQGREAAPLPRPTGVTFQRDSGMRTFLSVIVLLAGSCPAAAVAQIAQDVLARPVAHRTRSQTVDLAGLEQSFRGLAEALAPSVVAISSVPAGARVPEHLDGRIADGAALDAHLGRRGRVVGTGFCVAPGGIIVTNEHVVTDAGRLWCTTDDGRSLPALVLGTDPRSDLAVLKVPAELPPVPFAQAPAARGDWCLTLGNPLGLATVSELSLSVGVVSATGRSLPKLARTEDRQYDDLLQITAEVNPGNSGGPLFNLRGEVVGVVTAVVLPQRDAFGLGFAAPADARLRDRVAQLARGEAVAHAALGVVLREVLGEGGVLVAEVADRSPAADVLEVGDVIRAVDDGPLTEVRAMLRHLRGLNPAGSARLAVERGGQTLTLNVPLTEPPPHRRRAVTLAGRRLSWRGATLAPLPDAIAFAGVTGVAVIELDDDSPLRDEGVTGGSVVTAIGGRPVASLQDVLATLAASNDSAVTTADLLPTLALGH